MMRVRITNGLTQNGATLELVVQDGGSDDETLSVLETIDDPRLSIESRPDSGLYQGLNRAIARARGDWILWLNGDDVLTPGAIAAVAPHLGQPVEVRFLR